MQELECVGDSDGACLGDCLDAAIVLEIWCLVPCLSGVVTQSVASSGFDVNDYFCPYGCHWGSVKGEHAFQIFISEK